MLAPADALWTDWARLQAEMSCALRHGGAAPRGVVGDDGFAVHRNNGCVALIHALRAAYPVVERLVGEDFFHAAARLYSEAHPPASPVLAEYGWGFAAFLDGFEPARALPFLPDVARLEWLRNEAFHAADRTPLTAEDLAAIPPEQAGELVFAFHPSAGLVASAFPIVSLWEASADETGVRPIGPDLPGEAAFVIRPGLGVEVMKLGLDDADCVAALMAGATLQDAAGEAGTELTALARLLGRLIGAGAFCGVRRNGAAVVR